MNSEIKWNPNVRLVLSDVDETIADVYTPATPQMIVSLNKVLEKGVTLFMVSGGGLDSIRERVADRIKPNLRKQILIAHCSGAEVWGFDRGGKLNQEPYYGLYDTKVSNSQKKLWREIIDNAVSRFKLETFKTMPVKEFKLLTGGNPFAVMLADRGPQITFEFPNSYEMSADQLEQVQSRLAIKLEKHEETYDLRIPVMNYLKEEYEKEKLPINSKLSGVFALDNPIKDIDKTYAIRNILENKELLNSYGLPNDIETKAELIEIWGDKYSQKKGGPDFQMCKAVTPQARAIDFRKEDPNELELGYNIKIWQGQKFLHEGLLEFLVENLN